MEIGSPQTDLFAKYTSPYPTWGSLRKQIILYLSKDAQHSAPTFITHLGPTLAHSLPCGRAPSIFLLHPRQSHLMSWGPREAATDGSGALTSRVGCKALISFKRKLLIAFDSEGARLCHWAQLSRFPRRRFAAVNLRRSEQAGAFSASTEGKAAAEGA